VSDDANRGRGVYVPSCEFAHAGHELTQIIVRSKASREHDPVLARLLAASATWHFPGFRPDLVVSLPPKPGEEDRFRNIRRELAAQLGASDSRSALRRGRWHDPESAQMTQQRDQGPARRELRPSRRAALPHEPLDLDTAQVVQFAIVRRHPTAQVRHQLQLLGSGPGPVPAPEKLLEKPGREDR
jgi:hypothetical protein